MSLFLRSITDKPVQGLSLRSQSDKTETVIHLSGLLVSTPFSSGDLSVEASLEGVLGTEIDLTGDLAAYIELVGFLRANPEIIGGLTGGKVLEIEGVKVKAPVTIGISINAVIKGRWVQT